VHPQSDRTIHAKILPTVPALFMNKPENPPQLRKM